MNLWNHQIVFFFHLNWCIAKLKKKKIKTKENYIKQSIEEKIEKRRKKWKLKWDNDIKVEFDAFAVWEHLSWKLEKDQSEK